MNLASLLSRQSKKSLLEITSMCRADGTRSEAVMEATFETKRLSVRGGHDAGPGGAVADLPAVVSEMLAEIA
jgi:hypothetical protein